MNQPKTPFADLATVLTRNAAQADTDRHLPDENIHALRDAGVLRLATPPAYGAQGADLQTLLPILTELGQHCASTAWVASTAVSRVGRRPPGGR
jgi:alkylation response protein AidB-like acyl-CoA dehydrogenase